MRDVDRRGFLAGVGAFGGTCFFPALAGSCLGGVPNLRFGVLSDLHIRCVKGDHGYNGGPEAFEQALMYFRDREVDAVMIAGDMSDLGLGDELMLVGQTWDKVFPNDRASNGRKVEKLFITGNHESGIFQWNGTLGRLRDRYPNESDLRRQLLRLDYASWWEKAFHEPYERFYHKNVKGYDFLCAHWDDGSPFVGKLDDYVNKGGGNPESFGVDLEDWLDRNKSMLDPSKPFFYQQHRNLWKTTYGSWGWGHDKGIATRVLSAYPNAVTFSGDTHYSLTDERSIWQGAFTAFGTATLRYSGTPYDSRDLASFENTNARYAHRAKYDPLKTMPLYDPFLCRQGMVVSVYDDRMVAERRDFHGNRPLGDDWVVPLSAERPFAFVKRTKAASAPQFPAAAKLAIRRTRGQTRRSGGAAFVDKDVIEIVIPAACPAAGNRCIEYAVTAYGADGRSVEFNVLAEGFDRPVSHPRALGPTVFSVSTDRLPVGVERFTVEPLDCWWNRGRPLSVAMDVCLIPAPAKQIMCQKASAEMPILM